MRREYRKPEIMFESFSLTVHIAGDCNIKTNTPNSGKCAYEIVDEFGDVSNVFLSDMTLICTTKQPDGYNGICYDIPTETTDLFNS